MDFFGMKAKDKITGFSGTVVGRCSYISGCDQLLLAPGVKDDGSFQESHWFDIQRVEMLPGDAVTLDNSETPGPDAAAPLK
jgi:hypothetical protein